MSDSQPALTASTVSRRRFLTVAGAGVTTSALLTMLDAHQAPAQIKGTTLRILQWSHFIPAYDAWFDNKFVKDWGDKNGVKVLVDPDPALLQEPGRRERHLRLDRQEAGRMDPDRQAAGRGRRQAVRHPDVL